MFIGSTLPITNTGAGNIVHAGADLEVSRIN